MIQILLILLIAAFAQEMIPEPNCSEDTILKDGICQVIDFKNCDDPYDYGCGKPDGSMVAHDDIIGRHFLYLPIILVIIFVTYIVLWTKKKKK